MGARTARCYGKEKLKDNYRALALPDIHLEQGMNMDIVNLALKFGDWFRPDETIILGDLINFDYLSHWQEGNLQAKEGKRLKHDFDLANKILDRIDKFTKTKKVFLFGNHDNRLQAWISQHPVVDELVNFSHNLRLKERGYDIYLEGRVYKLGHARFVHGWYWNIYHSAKHVTQMGENIFYGHCHDFQAYSKPNYDQQPNIGQSLGCLCQLNPEYRKNRPNGWVNAFGVFYFFSSGQFNHYVPVIINGRFNFCGKVFQ